VIMVVDGHPVRNVSQLSPQRSLPGTPVHR
jgi:hypothetical protein